MNLYTNHKTNIGPDLYIETSVIVQKLYASEWLLFNTNSAIFQLYQDENKLIFNEMMMRSALYYINMCSCIFSDSSQKKEYEDRHVAPLWQIILILSQPVFAFYP
jgi:hypothetical protein